jgi:hypothetical protein
MSYAQIHLGGAGELKSEEYRKTCEKKNHMHRKYMQPIFDRYEYAKCD